MDQITTNLIVEGLINQNIRTHESTIALQTLIILFYFFIIIFSSYFIRNMNVFVRSFASIIAISLNLFIIFNFQTQLNVGKILLNVLSKLSVEGYAPMFKDSLVSSGLEPGSEIVIINPILFKIYIIAFFLFGILVPIYLYLFAKWEKN